MPVRLGRLAVFLLAPAAVLAAHGLGYAVAGHSHGGLGPVAHAHGYLPLATAVAVPLALLALLSSAVDRRPACRIPLRRVVALQWTAFALQEAVERLATAQPVLEIASSPALWFGFLAQLVVAPGGVLLLRAARLTGGRLMAVLSRPVAAALAGAGPLSRPAPLRVPAFRAWSSTPARSPPLVIG